MFKKISHAFQNDTFIHVKKLVLVHRWLSTCKCCFTYVVYAFSRRRFFFCVYNNHYVIFISDIQKKYIILTKIKELKISSNKSKKLKNVRTFFQFTINYIS